MTQKCKWNLWHVWLILAAIAATFVLSQCATKSRVTTATQPSAAEISHVEQQLNNVKQGDLVVWREKLLVYVVQKNFGSGERIFLFSPETATRVERQAKTMAPNILKVVRTGDHPEYDQWSVRVVSQIAGIDTPTQPAGAEAQ